MNEALKVKNLCFNYDENKETLVNLSFEVKKGDYVALIGHNGSGKSTLAKLLTYLITPSSGEIYVNGLLLNEENIGKIRRTLGIVFQNPDNQFIGSTVEDDIAFGLENRNIPLNDMQKLVKEYSKKVNMENYLKKEPSELSGGQKQRVAIAGILALNLKIIIFDEATSMLDPEGVEDIKHLINEMRKKDPELTFISITHDIEEAYLSDYCIILNKGRIYKEGKPNEILNEIDDIKRIGLDVPFVLKIKNALKEKNIFINDDIKTIEELAKNICK